MRTAIVVLGGFVLWAACLGSARLIAGASTLFMTVATTAFAALWFLAAALNMWVGVSQAGYTLREGLPIFLLIFLVRAGVAVVVKWKFL